MEAMVITEKQIRSFALGYGYNMELFEQYLAYQKANEVQMCGRWTLEEYACTKVLAGEDISMCNYAFQNAYAIWMGYGDSSFIPDYMSFEKYCSMRDLYELDPAKDGTQKDIQLSYA